MAKKDLIVVESPSKIAKIQAYAGPGYVVEASVGHFMELDDVDMSTFDPTYKVMSEKKQVLEKLKKLAKSVGTIYLATDPDREGEAISWHLSEQLSSINPNIKRIRFNEITKKAIATALAAPTALDNDLINAARARQILDRVVGFQVSPLAWKYVNKAKSAGRVQSPALRIIVERQSEIDAFKPVTYWTVEAELANAKSETFVASFVSKDRLEDLAFVKKVVEESKKANFKVEEVDKTKRTRNPYPPYDTSTLQQAANSVFGWPAKKTATIAQHLYQTGAITYIRTDSFAISDDALKMVRDHIEATYTKKYMPSTAYKYSKKSSAVKEQGAHECIRPTSITKPVLTDTDEKKLYELIYDRFLACQMVPAEMESTTYNISAGKHMYKATGSVITFDGFLKVWGAHSSSEDKTLPVVVKGDILKQNKVEEIEHQTKPPAAYTQGALVKQLEDLGIGRPSTYASIIDLISSKDRNYVEVDRKIFIPTEIGKELTGFLTKYFNSNFIEYAYTANLEKKLDEIADGKLDWKDVLKDTWKDLKEIIEKTRTAASAATVTTIACPLCKKGHLIIRLSKFGKFFSCSERVNKTKGCQYIASVGEDGNPAEKKKAKEAKKTEFKCPDCGAFLVERPTKKGTIILGCEKFPKCKSGFFDLTGKKIEFAKKGEKKKFFKKKPTQENKESND